VNDGKHMKKNFISLKKKSMIFCCCIIVYLCQDSLLLLLFQKFISLMYFKDATNEKHGLVLFPNFIHAD